MEISGRSASISSSRAAPFAERLLPITPEQPAERAQRLGDPPARRRLVLGGDQHRGGARAPAGPLAIGPGERPPHQLPVDVLPLLPPAIHRAVELIGEKAGVG